MFIRNVCWEFVPSPDTPEITTADICPLYATYTNTNQEVDVPGRGKTWEEADIQSYVESTSVRYGCEITHCHWASHVTDSDEWLATPRL